MKNLRITQRRNLSITTGAWTFGFAPRSGRHIPTMLIVICCLTLLVGACAPNAPAATPTSAATVVPATTLTVSGSGSVSGLLTDVKAAFEAETPGYALNVLSGSGTGGGVKGALDGILDIAAMARGPKEDETTQGLQYLNFGSTGVAIMVHPNVEITNLTQDQVQAIFMGEVKNWSEVGGQDLAIIVYVRDEDESATGQLRKDIFGDTPFLETVAGVLTSSGDMLSTIEGTPGSIGFGNWIATVGSDTKVKTVTLDGHTPDVAAYPVTTALGLGFVEGREETVQPLLNWLVSETGQAALGELGVISPSTT
jgi:phosphate transport system substrate-binding protein